MFFAPINLAQRGLSVRNTNIPRAATAPTDDRHAMSVTTVKVEIFAAAIRRYRAD